jgi:tape measure domain-containing protein
MLVVGELGARITGNATHLYKVLDDVKAKGIAVSKIVSTQFNELGRQMTGIGQTGTLRITAPIIASGVMAVRTAGQYEQLRKTMDVLTGSAEAGERQFDRLLRLSAQTPFQFPDLVKANNTLLGFNINAEQSFHDIKAIGDIAAITGGDMNQIAVAYGQAAAEQKLFTKDIRQLINNGVPAVKMLADTMGVAENQVFNLASQGKISFDILRKSFQDATTDGGMFADGMKQQATTINGLFSTLKDNITIGLGTIGNTIVDAFNLREVIPELTGQIQRALGWFKSLNEETVQQLVRLAGLGAIIPPIIAVVGVLAMAISAIVSPVGLVITGIAGLGVLAVRNFDEIKKKVVEVTNTVIGWYNENLLIRGVINGIILNFKNLLAVGQLVVKQIGDSFGGLGDIIGGVFSLDPKQIRQGFATVRTSMVENIEEAFSKIKSNVQEALEDTFTPKKPIEFITDEDVETQLSRFNELVLALLGLEGIVSGTGEVEKPVVENYLPTEVVLDNLAELDAIMEQMAEKWGGELMVPFQRAAGEIEIAQNAAQTFTNGMSSGLDSMIQRGKKFEDVLGDIGKMLLSNGIQTVIRLMLLGGSGGTGGLFSGLFSAAPSIPSIAPVAPSFNGANLEMAFANALKRHTKELSPSKVYQLSKEGEFGY